MSAVDGPAAPGALVGRDAERVRLAALLGGDRLVCVTGPGGVGKTHLVLAVVADQADDDPRHTVFCPLAEIEQAHAVRHAVAARLGVLNVDDPLGASLPVTPDGPGLLVVLDNCEHVIDAAAAVAEELLAAGPHVRVLATSREPLHLPGERVLSLRPLPVPADAAERGAADSPAVVLFTQRAQRARDGFSLDEATLPAVVEICRALDGLPLALEIAGARVRSLGVADIAARLGQRFTLLRASTRRAPARHRDLRAVVEWSYGLLNPAERTLFDRMSVYPAGFDVPAVLAAAAAVGLAAGPALEALDGLVTKSLVTVHDQADGTRYGLLETLRSTRGTGSTARSPGRCRHRATSGRPSTRRPGRPTRPASGSCSSTSTTPTRPATRPARSRPSWSSTPSPSTWRRPTACAVPAARATPPNGRGRPSPPGCARRWPRSGRCTRSWVGTWTAASVPVGSAATTPTTPWSGRSSRTRPAPSAARVPEPPASPGKAGSYACLA